MSSAFEGLPKTPNLSLNKPGYDNVADIEALNENSDILDDEINTIKSNLKNKGSATEPIYFDGNGVPQKTKNFNDYLPLAGGTMTGDIKASDSINSFVVGYNYDSNKGALIALRGTNYNTNIGGIEFITTDGSNKKTLVIKSDGTLRWDNKEIYHSGKTIPISNGGTGATTASDACANIGATRSVNGVNAGDDGNVDINHIKNFLHNGVLTKTSQDFNGLYLNNSHSANENSNNLPYSGTYDFNLLTIASEVDCLQLFLDAERMFVRQDDGQTGFSKWYQLLSIESFGSNWIRLINGLQICFENYISTNSSGETWITFPMPFKDRPSVTAVSSTNGVTGCANSVDSTKFALWGSGYSIHYIAIGWWE